MKKYFLALLFIIAVANFSNAQLPVPPGCECCAGVPDETACLIACDQWAGPGDYCSDLVPINSNILLLFALALSFGAYSVYQSKRKLLKN